MERITLFIPLVAIALIDFILMSKNKPRENQEPDVWVHRMRVANRKQRLKYKMALARLREDKGYGTE